MYTKILKFLLQKYFHDINHESKRNEIWFTTDTVKALIKVLLKK